ncbi:alpha/beta hydrolase [Nocardia stercoris]|uniref:Alpha/beta hydrolase n=1 Tax=Nocardia stercoris TaxID=2483361 RepID=A0A3M2LFQ9_9NOCA|nr:alpha/beta hydrolase [Nocardia stercoris]RMI35650.1 alpha/beta hydrolase [Nocardia stercoris]
MTNDTSVDAPETTSWQPDVLGAGFEQTTLPLGPDPDGEGEIAATLIRYTPEPAVPATGAVLYVHGFTDYFFQVHLAEHMAALGYRFYALDLRKCGRSTRAGQSPHFVRDLAVYDAELDRALEIVRAETGLPVLMMGHSTGGLVTALWLDRIERAAKGGVAARDISGVVFNSPWLDLQGPSWVRGIGTTVINTVGLVRPKQLYPAGLVTSYGDSLHSSRFGEWDYNLDWKPLTGFPVRLGWLRAIRQGHATVHRGLRIGVPALVLRGTRSAAPKEYGPIADEADCVLDVRQIQRWSGCFGDRTAVVPVPGARHDVFLSVPEVRAQAFAEMDAWLNAHAAR